MWIAVCDRCKCKAEPTQNSEAPAGWFNLSTRERCYSDVWRNYLLCPKCQAALHISAAANYQERQKSAADRLLEIIEEIVQGVQEE